MSASGQSPRGYVCLEIRGNLLSLLLGVKSQKEGKKVLGTEMGWGWSLTLGSIARCEVEKGPICGWRSGQLQDIGTGSPGHLLGVGGKASGQSQDVHTPARAVPAQASFDPAEFKRPIADTRPTL